MDKNRHGLKGPDSEIALRFKQLELQLSISQQRKADILVFPRKEKNPSDALSRILEHAKKLPGK